MLVTVAAGTFNCVEARGHVLDDWTEQPLEADIRLGDRSTKSWPENGSFVSGIVPRGMQLDATRPSYGKVEFPP